MISDINIHVDRDLCYACGICVERCILDNLRLHLAPCRAACPIHMNCQGYVRLIAQEKEEEAADDMRNYLPFGGILGRICTHPCEAECERQKVGDGAVHIRALKRYLADTHPDVTHRRAPVAKETGRRVAVVGSGPAGLMAAHELRSCGHAVTIYEAASEPGGLLRWGIPSFRLPISEISSSIGMLEKMGIVFRTAETIGKQTEFSRLEADYDAVLVAIGAGSSARLGIPGEELDGVYQGLDLLREVKDNGKRFLGESVIVIGGGNTAVNVALTCLRLGAKHVKIVCLEDREQMPAFPMELRDVLEEGVEIEHCWGPTRFVQKDDGKIKVELSRCLSLVDEQGRFCPQLDEECGMAHEADALVVAIGQALATECIPSSLLKENRFAVDPVTLQALSGEKAFVCGDACTGPSSVVEAMAHGREAAISIDRFLCGEGMRWGRDFWNGPYVKEYEVDLSRAKGGARRELVRLAVRQRTLNEEIEKGFTPEAAKEEAERCLSCGRAAEMNQTCWYCLPCEIECPVDALEVRLPYLIR